MPAVCTQTLPTRTILAGFILQPCRKRVVDGIPQHVPISAGVGDVTPVRVRKSAQVSHDHAHPPPNDIQSQVSPPVPLYRPPFPANCHSIRHA